MKLIRYSFIYVPVLNLLISCSPIKMSELNSYYTPIPVTSKSLDIPKYDEKHPFVGYPYVYWNFCKQKERQLNLVSPEICHDSLIFRLWVTNPVGKRGQKHGLLELKKDTTGWNGKFVLMYVDLRLKHLSETITSSTIIELSPLKTDWKTIADSLDILKIAELPTDDLIPGYYPVEGGYANNSATFSFEYATRNTYRFYQYNDLYRARSHFWQPDNVIKILDLLESEFQFDSKARQYFSQRRDF